LGGVPLTQREFVDTIRALAARHAVLSPEGAAAHGANESRFGNSQLASEFGNALGVRATSSWLGETVDLPMWEEVDGRVVQATAACPAYPSWVEAVAD